MPERIARTWLLLAAGLLLLTPVDGMPRGRKPLTDLFLATQDLPVLLTIAAVAAALWSILAPRRRFALAAPAPVEGALAPSKPILRSSGWMVAGLAALVGVTGLVGAQAVFDSYPLSLDEFMATFDATIHGHGDLLAKIPAPWRSYAPALQPQFMRVSPGGRFWSSAYLPVNAALRGLAGLAGARALVSPLLAAVSVVAVHGVGRRMWPDRPSIALMAAILLATSSQLLITAMTPYAMTAHLAFNMVWLWLFLRGGRLGHAGAIAVGFLACGLHQLVFHPLFVAPFVLTLWLERRWRTAALYTLAYGAILLFWIEYPALAAHLAGDTASGPAPGAPSSAGAGVGGFAAQALGLIGAFDPAGIGLMAKNLIRFVVWQNPLAAPLVVLGAGGAVRAKGTPRALLLGLALTTAAVFVVLPYQGHGWGYRYLHGCLGSVALLAALEWTRLTDALTSGKQTLAQVAFVAVAGVSLFALAPLRAAQARAIAQPYALAEAAIRRAPTDLVLVDDTASWFTADLVRNDPYLRNRPIVLLLGALSERQLDQLCARDTISLFDADDARRFGILTEAPRPRDAAALARLGRARRLTCGAPRAPVRGISARSQ